LLVGEEAEVADAHEAAREQVQEKAAQELVDRQSQKPLFVGMCGVTPAKRDVALLESNEPAVGNGDAMGVAAGLLQDGDVGVGVGVFPEGEEMLTAAGSCGAASRRSVGRSGRHQTLVQP
jgi:hypothetical protein